MTSLSVATSGVDLVDLSIPVSDQQIARKLGRDRAGCSIRSVVRSLPLWIWG